MYYFEVSRLVSEETFTLDLITFRNIRWLWNLKTTLFRAIVECVSCYLYDTQKGVCHEKGVFHCTRSYFFVPETYPVLIQS